MISPSHKAACKTRPIACGALNSAISSGCATRRWKPYPRSSSSSAHGKAPASISWCNSIFWVCRLDTLAGSLHDDPELATWWGVFRAAGLAGLPTQRHAEIALQAQLAGRRLIAKYDLLALEAGGQAVIVDWKTWRQATGATPSCRSACRPSSIDTVLAKAGDHLYGGPIPPEKIRMIYCFVAQQGERVSINYSAEQLRQDEAYLLSS